MKLLKSKIPFENPLTYLVLFGLTAVWCVGLGTSCALPREVLSGENGDVMGSSRVNTLVFWFVSLVSILTYAYLAFKTPSLLLRVIFGILWSPITCLIYVLLMFEINTDTGVVATISKQGLSFASLKGSFGQVALTIFYVPLLFLGNCAWVLLLLVPGTIYLVDRMAHVYGLTAVQKRLAFLTMQQQLAARG